MYPASELDEREGDARCYHKSDESSAVLVDGESQTCQRDVERDAERQNLAS